MLSLPKHLARFVDMALMTRARCFGKLSMTVFIDSNSFLDVAPPLLLQKFVGRAQAQGHDG